LTQDELLERVFVSRITVENFKSIKELELRLEPGLNVLVGANASGKTNILEAVSFLREALIGGAKPGLPRRGFGLNMVHNRDPARPVRIRMSLEHYEPYFGMYFAEPVDFTAEFTYEPSLDALVPSRLVIEISGDASIEVTSDRVKVSMAKGVFDWLKMYLNEQEAQRWEWIREPLSKASSYSDAGVYYVAEIKLPDRFSAPSIDEFSLKRGLIDLREADGGYVLSGLRILSETDSLPVLTRIKRVNNPRGVPIASYGDLAVLIRNVLAGVFMISGTSELALTGPKWLNEAPTNLASVLASLMEERDELPDRVVNALKTFPGVSLKLRVDGDDVAVVFEENGLEIPPSSAPKGLTRLLALATVAELEPTILLVDDIEAGLHPSTLERVVDILNSLNAPVIATTHSPILVDLVGPERTFIVMRNYASGTFAEKIKDPDKLMERLREEGIALSDYVFYNRTRQVAG